MNCFATGVHMAGTVSTHWISLTLKYVSPVLSQITLRASSFKNLIEWENTVNAFKLFPLAALIVVWSLTLWKGTSKNKIITGSSNRKKNGQWTWNYGNRLNSQLKNDPRSCEDNLRNCVRSLKKILDFKGIWTRDLAIPVRCLNQLSYEATDVGSWSIMCSYVRVYENFYRVAFSFT